MPIDILMPALSPTMEQGKLAKWLKAEGDRVKAGDIIAEIETDKATMEVEAVDEGVVEDILVPEGYAAEICRLFDSSDWEVAHLQRFLFYLGPEATRALVANGPLSPVIPADVRQNWCGGTLAIRKAAYAAIGGFDERFVDWGGEDNEFFDRCGSLKQFAFGYVPFIHLWHPPQANKFGPGRDRAVAFMHDRLALPVAQRIAELRSRQPVRGVVSFHSWGGESSRMQSSRPWAFSRS